MRGGAILIRNLLKSLLAEPIKVSEPSRMEINDPGLISL